MLTLYKNMVNQLNLCYSYRWLLFFLLYNFFFGFDAYSQSRQQLEEQRKEILEEIEEISRFLNETQQSQRESVAKLNLLTAQVNQFNRLITGINAEITYADRQISETTVTVNRMTNEIEKMKMEYARLVYQAYKNRGQYNKLVYVLSAKDFNEAYRRMKYFRQYSEYRKKQVDEIKIKQEELRDVIAQLTAQKDEKEKLLAQQRQESKRLEAVKTEQNREVNNLKSQERRLRTQLTTQQQKEKRLQTEIEKIITAEARKSGATTTNLYDKLTPEEILIANNFKGNKGRLPWPTERGTITGKYGSNYNPILKSNLESKGIDITTVGGADVRAVFDGEILEIVLLLGDVAIVVRHGNYFTIYSNLAEVKVKKGDKVKTKDIIGKVYTVKGEKTAVLHFEIWEEFNKQNPELWIVKQ